jgi:hypothetical protein
MKYILEVPGHVISRINVSYIFAQNSPDADRSLVHHDDLTTMLEVC